MPFQEQLRLSNQMNLSYQVKDALKSINYGFMIKASDQDLIFNDVDDYSGAKNPPKNDDLNLISQGKTSLKI
jgi:hypothetical protein